MKAKDFFKNMFIFLFMIFITYYLIFRKQNMFALLMILRKAKIEYILMAIGAMLLYFLIEGINVKYLLKSLKCHISTVKAFRYTLIGFFFSSITPAATGGQPVEIYYMSKEGVPVSKATTALLINLSAYQICTISLALICFFLRPFVLPDHTIWLFILGISLNSLILIFLLIFIFHKSTAEKMVAGFLKFLSKFKLKNIDKINAKVDEEMVIFKENAQYIKKHKKEFALSVLRIYFQTAVYYIVPFLIYKSFGFNNYNIFDFFIVQAVLHGAVSCIPLPGAVGISESVFLKMYVFAFGFKFIKPALLLSRGVSFYLFVIVSMLAVLYTTMKSSSRNEEK